MSGTGTSREMRKVLKEEMLATTPDTTFVNQASDPMILPSVAIAASIRGDQGVP